MNFSRTFSRFALGGFLLVWGIGTAPAQAGVFDLMQAEKIGPLKLGLAVSKLPDFKHCKLQKGERQFWGADGAYHQHWFSKVCGFDLVLLSERQDSAQTLESVRIFAPNAWKTLAGIGLGNSLAQVQKAYGKHYNAAESLAGKTFVAGSIYGGLILSFDKGKVSEIFLGAGAE
ncbi:hypothetical protein COW36_12845 [bacterium (Candidatus Blackallbacteria) CG17_big_fil_post_rev_8_21_14_2_50_48_46]|uniref:Uncharacterized protein n=1 Tax=bacterium (Candidatus Blackallbacteria) CG17_big_fil_post_rev_8_21_14_2_50_48_46 TaxID=2014261 RepID=A0A2M7G4A3_9BACT|nr:MAG: hypothetical protein COW64_02420 [bacterium (Candidatus Blackallbacteria) CG18_big_fil_WC_8_21_14_2_50_49_26]PIW16647.1 MAG: hypothetical protein COW36_12845 [bacterium (Candidatus Blackallbacteria) CG17_big_fil_post_rev_8_21_14_2_50_48_46]